MITNILRFTMIIVMFFTLWVLHNVVNNKSQACDRWLDAYYNSEDFFIEKFQCDWKDNNTNSCIIAYRYAELACWESPFNLREYYEKNR